MNAKNNVVNISDLVAQIKKLKKNATVSEANLKEIDNLYLKKIKSKRNEIIQLRKKIELNDNELAKAFSAFEDIYYVNLDDDKLLDTKDKALAQKTLSFRKSVRDYDLKIEKLNKEYNEVIKNIFDEIQSKKKLYLQQIMDLDRKRKNEIAKERKTRQAELSRLNKLLSETNDRNKINEINERINSIKKETLDGIKAVEEKYINQRKDVDILNIESLRDDELKQNKLKYEFELNKLQINIQKRHDKLNYDLENKKYMLEVREANSSFKKDLILKKNGALVSHEDNNRELYKRLVDAVKELFFLQTDYNNKIIESTFKDYKDRLSYENDNIKFLSVDVNLTVDKLKCDNPFFKSLTNFNDLYLEHLKSCIDLEFDNVLLDLRLIYSSLGKAEYKYKEIDEEIKTLINKYLNKTIKYVNELFDLNKQIESGVIKYLKESKDNNRDIVNNKIKEIINKRSELYLELNNKVNDCISNYALGKDKEIIKYQDDLIVKKYLEEEQCKYLLSGYKSIEEEMKAIDKIYNDEIENVKKEKGELDSYVESEERNILDDENREKEVIEKEFNDKNDLLNSEFKKQYEEIMNNYKIQIKNNEEDYKTENKLL